MLEAEDLVEQTQLEVDDVLDEVDLVTEQAAQDVLAAGVTTGVAAAGAAAVLARVISGAGGHGVAGSRVEEGGLCRSDRTEGQGAESCDGGTGLDDILFYGFPPDI